mgnify:FL=1
MRSMSGSPPFATIALYRAIVVNSRACLDLNRRGIANKRDKRAHELVRPLLRPGCPTRSRLPQILVEERHRLLRQPIEERGAVEALRVAGYAAVG